MPAPVPILKIGIMTTLKVIFSALGLPWIRPGLQGPRNFLGRCRRPMTLGGEGLMWQARGQVIPTPPAPPWPLGNPDARLIQLVGQLRPQPALAASCRETVAEKQWLPHTGRRWPSLWWAGPRPGKGTSRLPGFGEPHLGQAPASREEPWCSHVSGVASQDLPAFWRLNLSLSAPESHCLRSRIIFLDSPPPTLTWTPLPHS